MTVHICRIVINSIHFKDNHLFKRLVTTLFVLQSLFISVISIQAQALSPGCNTLNDPSLDGLFGGVSPGGSPEFFANELMEIHADYPVTPGIATQIALDVSTLAGTVYASLIGFPGTLRYLVPEDGIYAMFWRADTNVTWTVSCRFVPPSSPIIVETCPVFFDGRINNCDTASPIAVYPHDVNGETGLIIYGVDGEILLIISPQQLANVDDNPENPILIVEENGVTLYRIPGDDSGQWQINAPQYNGKIYVLIFSELFADAGYISFEED